MTIERNLLVPFIEESNRIERIFDGVREAEIDAYEELLNKEVLTCSDIEDFVEWITGPCRDIRTKGELRCRDGMNVRIGSYFPPLGNKYMARAVDLVLGLADHNVNHNHDSSYNIHMLYENLHPFTDGNGRSGRALWLWMVIHNEKDFQLLRSVTEIGFLHTWYYESLRHTARIETEGLLMNAVQRVLKGEG